MGKKFEGGYYAVIPAVILFDAHLSANAKLLYAIITSLCDQEGFCWASNDYLAAQFETSERAVSRWISQLERLGVIRSEMVANAKGSERRIYAGIFAVKVGGVDKNVYTGVDKNGEGGVDKNVHTPKGRILNNNNQTVNIPPIIPPEGGPPAEELKTKRSSPALPGWKPERFKAFWAYYRSVAPGVNSDRQKTARAWDKLRPSDELLAEMGQALKRYAATEEWTRGIGIPHASTWINGRWWERAEDLPAPKAAAGTGWSDDPEVIR